MEKLSDLLENGKSFRTSLQTKKEKRRIAKSFGR